MFNFKFTWPPPLLLKKMVDALPKPTLGEEIGRKELKALIEAKCPNAEIYLSDRTYYLCSVEDIKVFLKYDKTDKKKYVREYHDCDDFSYRLMGQFSVPQWSGLAFGICWTNKHALNCFIDSDKELWYIEPQTDDIYSFTDYQGGNVRLVVM